MNGLGLMLWSAHRVIPNQQQVIKGDTLIKIQEVARLDETLTKATAETFVCFSAAM